jgi:bacillopeptidase F (M6 metalloprotease family)
MEIKVDDFRFAARCFVALVRAFAGNNTTKSNPNRSNTANGGAGEKKNMK